MGDLIKVSATPDGVAAWSGINWSKTGQAVERLQVRIAKATREKRWGKVRSLQRLLVQSLPARRLAVRRVTTSQGARTPGVDGVLWNTSRKKMQAVDALRKRRGYRPLPLSRVYIPKPNGKKRALGIPSLKDRAKQALYLLALEPVAEQRADPNSYGFRKARSIQDAHDRCRIVLAKGNAATWVLDADIEACFDRISHSWLLQHIPMDKNLLSKWLKAGYFDGNLYHPTEQGTPQGGPLSPTLANMTLDGLEAHIQAAIKPLRGRHKPSPKVHVIRYADDLVITARTREILVEVVIPALVAFLEDRGLNLSQEKTKIVHIEEGFDFLGANIRKYQGKFRRRPTKSGIRELIRKTRNLLRQHQSSKTEVMLQKLNRLLRGWAYQFRHIAAAKAFSYIDHCIFRQLWRWARRRHNNQGAHWVKQRYFTTIGNNRWVFHAQQARKDGKVLFRMSSLPIRQYIKVRAEARYHDARYMKYFKERWRQLHGHHDHRRWTGQHQLKLPFHAQDLEQPGRPPVGL